MPRRFHLLARRLALLAAALVLLPGVLAAQRGRGRPVRANGVKNLTFGTIIQGMPRTIARTDGVNAGEIQLSGPHGAPVVLQFVLPAAMSGPGGASMPVSFAGAVAGFSPDQDIANQTGFDPRLPYAGAFSQQGRAAVFLGGTAQPAAGQAPGSYTGTIVLNVIFP